MRPRAQAGFTLIEVLVASAIFAIVSLAAFAGWEIVSTTKGRQETAQASLTRFDRAFLLLQQDLTQLSLRGISDELGGEEAPIELNTYDGGSLSFTRAGHAVVVPELTRPRSELQRVRWQLLDDKWQRLSWPHLDRMAGDDARVRTLLEDVDTVSWRFLNAEREWTDSWPPLDRQPGDPFPLPVAIEMSLVMDGQAPIPRLFLVGD